MLPTDTDQDSDSSSGRGPNEMYDQVPITPVSSNFTSPVKPRRISTVGTDAVGELGFPLPHNRTSLPRFANIVRFFESMGKIHGNGAKLARDRLILKFMHTWKTKVGDDIYPAVRLWFPNEDDQLRQFPKLREQQVGRAFVEAMNIPPHNADAQLLTTSRRGPWHGNTSHEDSLPSRIRVALLHRYPPQDFGQLRINEVIDYLIQFSGAKREERAEIIRDLLTKMNVEELVWFTRILLRNLSLNISEKSFLRLFHDNALQVFVVNKNLRTVCEQLWSREFDVAEKDKSVHLMSYFCPMKAKFERGASQNMDAIVQIMGQPKDSSTFYIEEKIDGERIQVHWNRADNQLKFFSRKGTDYTSSYVNMFGTESLSESMHGIDMPRFHDIVADNIQNCILDGEVIAWDPLTNDVCGQSKVRELVSHNRSGAYRHMILVFDVVFYNNQVLTEKPLKDRKHILETIFPVEKRTIGAGQVQILPYKVGHTAQDISKEFNRVIQHMSEGLVVKNLESKYELDGKSQSWVKVKPEYVDGYYAENLDLIVVGALRGSGKHATRLASFLCALKDETNPNRYVAFNYVGSGICLAMYNYINGILQDKVFASLDTPSWLDLGCEKRPDFYVKPEDSIVLEVKYSEISAVMAEKLGRNAHYGVGYALRFPRYVRTRDDKDLNSCLTIDELIKLYHSCQRQPEAKANTEIKKRSQQGQRIALAKRIKHSIEDRSYDVKKDVFNNQPFFIAGDVETPKYMTKYQLESLIKLYGGTTHSIYSSQCIPIADTELPKVVQLKAHNVVILKPSYIHDCIASGYKLIPEPLHYYCHANLSPYAGSVVVDKFNFSLYRRQNPEEISSNFSRIDVSSVRLTRSRRSEVLTFLLSKTSKTRLLAYNGMKFYLTEDTTMPGLIKKMILHGNGEITESLEEATHIIIHDLEAKNENNVTFPGKFVDERWVFSTWESRNSHNSNS